MKTLPPLNRSRGATLVVSLYKKLSENPNDATSLYKLGQVYLHANELNRAGEFFCQAIAAEQNNPLYYVALGKALLAQRGRNFEAICAFRHALSLDSNLSGAYNGLGHALMAADEIEQAVACFRKAVEKEPLVAAYWLNLSSALSESNDYSNAYDAALKARSIAGNSQRVCICLSEACLGLGKFIMAQKWLHIHLRRNSKWAAGCHNLGRILQATNRLNEAINYFKRAIAIEPDNYDARFGLATCLLAMADFNRGWHEYESRFKARFWQKSVAAEFMDSLTEPMWAGESLSGKTLLLYGEQGFGDTIQMIRYTPVLAKQNCRVIVMVYNELVALMRSVPGVSSVVGYGDLIPRYDFHVPLFSVPKILKTDIQSIPSQVPYVFPPLRRTIPTIINSVKGLRVGIAWSTKRLNSQDFRCANVDVLKPLLDIKSINFYNLQINDVYDNTTNNNPNVHSLKIFISNWEDTSFLMSKLHVVIAVDTGVAHLAGAMGLPIWLMLQHPPEWRWLSVDSRSKWFRQSPWYPTMRIFRASSHNDWVPVIKELKLALIALSKTIQKKS